MKIEVRLYAGLRRYGSPKEPALFLDVAEECRVAQVIEMLSMPAEAEKVILINGRPGEMTSKLKEGDLVVFFPPVAGG